MCRDTLFVLVSDDGRQRLHLKKYVTATVITHAQEVKAYSVMDLTSITSSIRVDHDTKKGSVIDVIRLVNPNLTSSNAGNTLTKLSSDMGIQYTQLRINGKGKLTPVADARELVEVVWALPGKAARDFRRASAQTVCRVLGGDLRLVEEIELRHHTMQ
eukprot:8139-Heterococcus_DN1.PRE.1